MKTIDGAPTYGKDEMTKQYAGTNALACRVVDLEVREYGESTVFDIILEAAPENSGSMGKRWSFENGKPTETGDIDKGAFIGQKEKYSAWLTPNVSREDAWRNNKYYEAMELLGVECPKTPEDKYIPFAVELSDILGVGVVAKFDWVADKNDPEKVWNNIVGLRVWPNAKRVVPKTAADDLLSDDTVEGEQTDEDELPF